MKNKGGRGLLNFLKRTWIIDQDWKFYIIALLPYFFAAFALWIFIDEGFFAQRYGIPIIWALPLLFGHEYEFPHLWYHWAGVAVLIVSMVMVGFIIVYIRRAPSKGKTSQKGRFTDLIHRGRGWVRGKYPLPLLTVAGVVFLAIGIIMLVHGFSLLQLLIINESVILHQLGNLLVAIGLVLTFILIICERAEEEQ